jgi:isochorismate pyruvate lyase
MTKPPAHCANMTELRAEIDRLDKDLVALLAQRTAYIDRAAQIKSGVGLCPQW